MKKNNKEDKNEEDKESKSFFGPNFRKWLHMKRQLRLVHEEEYEEKIHIPRIQYKLKKYWVDFVYQGVEETKELYNDFDLVVYQAVMHRDHHPLISLLNDGLNPNYRLGRRQRTLLQHAALKGDPELVIALLERGANVNAKDSNGDNALYLALNIPLNLHKITILKMLYEAGIKVNHHNHDGWTPLHRVCLLGEPKLVELILQFNCKVYSKTIKDNVLPLQLVKKNHDEILSLFSSHLQVNPVKRYSDHLHMWAHIMSRDFVATLFEIVEPNCIVCKRKTRKCGKMKKENYRYWLLIHDKKPR